MSCCSIRRRTCFTTLLGLGQAYRDATGNSTFTAETHTLYEREVRVGERVRVVPHLLGADTKRLHYFHEMFHAEHGHRVAAQELMALHIDMSVRKVAPFPTDVHDADHAGRECARGTARCRWVSAGASRCQDERTGRPSVRSAAEELLCPALVITVARDAPHRLCRRDALKIAGLGPFAQRLQRVVDSLHGG